METSKNDAYKLSLDDLSVSTFEPVGTPDPMVQALVQQNVGIVDTGCDSACTECTFGG